MTNPYPTVTPEITNYDQALTYTDAMQRWAGTVTAFAESHVAQMQQMREVITQELANVDQAEASLRQHGFTGEQVAQMVMAKESLTEMQRAFQAATEALAKLPDSTAAAAGAFGTAHRTFAGQAGLAEQVRAHAEGNRADQVAFYHGQ